MNNHDKLIQEINQIPDHLVVTLIDIIHQLKKITFILHKHPKPPRPQI